MSRFRSLVQVLDRNACCRSLRPRCFCVAPNNRHNSFAVSYLINSLGFSPESAKAASKRLSFETREKPDKAVDFLRDFGFTPTQISRVVRLCPVILVSDTEKTILPKLEFLVGKGISRPELAKSLSLFPTVLRSSLSNQIVPRFKFLRTFFPSDEMAIIAVRRHPNILFESCVKPNIAVLQDHGVPRSNIATFIRTQPRYLLLRPDKFCRVVEEVAEMGFNASRVNFIFAVFVKRGMANSTWERKVNAFKKWGWSDRDVSEAFARDPRFMMVSEDKISACMDLFVNKLGWSPCTVAKSPIILGYSLEKRIVPRFLVYQSLLSKGLRKKENGPSMLFRTSDSVFLQKFVTCHQEEAPELLKLFNANGSKNDRV